MRGRGHGPRDGGGAARQRRRSGRGRADGFGLPALPLHDRRGDATRARAQPELRGTPTDAWHQVGNDHIVANAYNHGYIQLWSQDRLLAVGQPLRRRDRALRRRLRLPAASAARRISTLYADRPRGRAAERDFGVGYSRRRLRGGGRRRRRARLRAVRRRPGAAARRDDHATRRGAPRSVVVVRVLGRQPVRPGRRSSTRGLGAAAPATRRRRTLSRRRRLAASRGDTRAADDLRRRAATARSTATRPTPARFFGAGTRAGPAAVAADKLSDHAPPPASPTAASARTLFAFRAPVRARARASRSRCATPTAWRTPAQIPALVAQVPRRAGPVRAPASARGRAGVPEGRLRRRAALGRARARSGTPTCCARRGLRGGVRAPHHHPGRLLPVRHRRSTSRYRELAAHMLPMIYADAGAGARDPALLGPASSRRAARRRSRTASAPLCTRFDLGTSNDLDFWLLLAAAEYGLGHARHRRSSTSRCRSTARRQRRRCGSTSRRAFAPPGVAARPARRLRRSATTGDWSDFSTAVPADDRVDARHRAARLRLPAAGRARRRCAATRRSPRSCATRRARPARRLARASGPARLVLARLRRRPARSAPA